MFNHWAQSVVSNRWAVVCVVLHTIGRLTNFRFGRGHHRAWERAVGVAR